MRTSAPTRSWPRRRPRRRSSHSLLRQLSARDNGDFLGVRLTAYDRPFLCAFSDGDPITKGGERAFIGHVPGSEGQLHTTIEGAGHFLQEDKGEELGRVIADFIAR